MAEHLMPNGNRLHMPDRIQRPRSPEHDDEIGFYQCKCHKMLGNDFWFLPTGCCIRDKDAVCNHERVD